MAWPEDAYGPMGPEGPIAGGPSDEYLIDDEIRDALEESGYTYVSGHGAQARYRAGENAVDEKGYAIEPGTIVSAGRTLDALYGEDFNPYRQEEKEAKKPDRITQGGIVYEIGSDGRPRQLIPSQQASGGMTDYQRASLSQSAANQARDDEYRKAALAESIRNNTIQLGQKDREIALQTQLAEFNRNETIYARGIKNQEMADRAADRMFAQQQSIAALNMQKAQLQTQIAQANAQMQQQYERDRSTFEGQRSDRMASINQNIGELAADPADRGQYAATVLANSGWGQQAGALGQADLRTEESLQPLAGQLDVRQMVAGMQGPQRPTPLAMPDLSGIDLSAVSGGSSGGGANQGWIDAQAAMGRTGVQGTYTSQGNGPTVYTPPPNFTDPDDALSQAELAALIGGDRSVLGDTSYAGAAGLPKAKDGGVVNSKSGAYVGDEEGPEIHIPLGPGKAVVLNEQQAEAAGINLKRLRKMADGGIFGSPILNTSKAREFSDDTYRRALKGTPWEGGDVPSAVFASSPGFDPIVAQLLASISAAGGRGPASSYLRNANLLRPAGMNERAIGRSA